MNPGRVAKVLVSPISVPTIVNISTAQVSSLYTNTEDDNFHLDLH